MPNFNDIVNEVNAAGSGFDLVRRKYIAELADYTKRNVIVYYSGWLQKPIPQLQAAMAVNDNDKNGFMATIHQLDKAAGLDLLLHTPGGDTAATESLVEYLRQMFGSNIRAFVPQLAMSAGTMIAFACKEIFMGKHSNLGPINPQIGPFPAHGVKEEFKRAKEEIQTAKDAKEQQAKIAVWQPIIAKYNPTLIGLCEQAITWSTDIVTKWLMTGMFEGDSDAAEKANRIVNELGSHTLTKTHARHIHLERLKELGVKVVALEDDQKLQDAVLTVHHACIHTLTHTPAVKIIENHNKTSFIMAAQIMATPTPPQQQLPPQP
jgi:ATP-dependent protease ClpP protease subunit